LALVGSPDMLMTERREADLGGAPQVHLMLVTPQMGAAPNG
jgi:hypothetical protein